MRAFFEKSLAVAPTLLSHIDVEIDWRGSTRGVENPPLR